MTKKITSIMGDNQVECPKCYSYFHRQYLAFHMSKCVGKGI
jgi:uncharacterized protein (DUF2225 family)